MRVADQYESGAAPGPLSGLSCLFTAICWCPVNITRSRPDGPLLPGHSMEDSPAGPIAVGKSRQDMELNLGWDLLYEVHPTPAIENSLINSLNGREIRGQEH